jgi:hypothetical protein
MGHRAPVVRRRYEFSILNVNPLSERRGGWHTAVMDLLTLALLVAISLITGAVCAWRGRTWWFGALVVVLVLFGQKQLAAQGEVTRIALLAGAAGLVWVGATAYRVVERCRGDAEELQQAEAG